MRKLTLEEIKELKVNDVCLMKYGFNRKTKVYAKILINDDKLFSLKYTDREGEERTLNARWLVDIKLELSILDSSEAFKYIEGKAFDLYKIKKLNKYEIINGE